MPSTSESGATGGGRGARGTRSCSGDGGGGGGGGSDGSLNNAPGRYPPGSGGKPRPQGTGETYTAGGMFNSGASAAGKRKGRWDDQDGGEGARRKMSGKGKERAKGKGKGKGRLMVRDHMG